MLRNQSRTFFKISLQSLTTLTQQKLPLNKLKKYNTLQIELQDLTVLLQKYKKMQV